MPARPGMGNMYNNFFILIYFYFFLLICRWEGCFIVRFELKLGAILGRNFDVTIGRDACETCSATWNFGYHLSICSGIEENHGKSGSSWPVAGPSGCKLTSTQQSGIKDENPNISPYLAVVYLYKFTYYSTVSFHMHMLDDQQTFVYNFAGVRGGESITHVHATYICLHL
jgi:hypothetical protein